jgi:anti-sigma factor RsiW
MKWIWNRCRRRLDASLLAAGVLGEEEKIELERHWATCEECRRYYGEIKTLTAPLVAWEKGFSAIQVTPATQRRWVRAVQESGRCGRSVWPLFRNLWCELLWPSRYAWTGLAALWVALLVINAQLSDHPAHGANDHAGSSQDMIQAWREQTRVLAELIQPSLGVPTPPPYIPRPRSQKRQNSAII